MDDAGGCVAAGEAVRLMKALGLRPRRTVRVVLWTNEVLAAARGIYVAEGFVLQRSEPHESFGATLVGEYWSRPL
jgi:predicted naringenin-chalcone synthase